MLRLIVNPGQTTQQEFRLKTGPNSIGRARENDVVILDQSLSRYHARIDVMPDKVMLSDLQSRNGTFVNGDKIDSTSIKSGDSLQWGDVVCNFVRDSAIRKEISGDLSNVTIEDLLIKGGKSASRDRLQIVLKVSQLLSSPEMIDQLLETVLDLLFQIMPVERAVILLQNETTGELEPRIARSKVEGIAEPYSKTITRYVMERNVSVFSADAREDERFVDSNSITDQSIRSSMCVPLKIRERSLGVIYVDNLSVPSQFAEQELEFLTGFAGQAAIAIDNARLYRSLEDERKKREEELLKLVEDRTANLSQALREADAARKEAERQKEIAELAMAAAKDANLAKSQFLANISHELRTPLNAIIGYSEIMEEEAKDIGVETLATDNHKIQTAAKHLLALINDILDLSKIEAGRMELSIETFDLYNLVEDVVSTMRPLAEKNANVLIVECNPNVGFMRADLVRIRQILLNLLSNACKFTEKGMIRLNVVREREGDADWILFRVKDSGIGMNQEQLARLFQPFMQADASTTRKYGGTGLGLVISRRFCQMMNGDIDVESEVGTGTIFTVHLPAELPTADDNESPLLQI